MDIENNNNSTQEEKKPSPSSHKYWIGTYLIIAAVCLVLYYFIRYRPSVVFTHYAPLISKLLMAGFISFIVLALAAFAQKIVWQRSKVKTMRYNLVQGIRLLSALIVIMIFISVVFQNWYTAAVSLGLISLILGFALQTPISSFIGWLYIIFRSPYHVGDRIQVDTFTGDVVEIGYLDTTLWEFAGNYLTNDMPSGRLIRFPNTLVLQSAVFNYSWKKFPYIWNEVPFHVAYESDLEYVENTLKEVAKKELGPEMAEHINELKKLVQQTPVDELQIKEYPYVAFRTNANTWLEATLTYLVPPKQATGLRSRIIKNAVQELLKQPGKVMFPNGNSR